MARIPRRYAPYLYGVIQAAITTAVATGIATYQMPAMDGRFFVAWGYAWGMAWLTMLPVVVFIAPVIQRAVAALTMPDVEKS